MFNRQFTEATRSDQIPLGKASFSVVLGQLLGPLIVRRILAILPDEFRNHSGPACLMARALLFREISIGLPHERASARIAVHDLLAKK
jgi:hypothetical protein